MHQQQISEEGHIPTYVVCPDFQGLLFPHQQPDTLGLFVFQQFDLTGAPFFPFPRFIVKSVQLAFPTGETTDNQTCTHDTL